MRFLSCISKFLSCIFYRPKPSIVKLAGEKCLTVNGKPFFAIGMYDVNRIEDFAGLADAGFNLVHCYKWEGNKDYEWGKKWLDAAEENGLKALVGFYRDWIGRKKNFDLCGDRIKMYRDHPALLAWHMMDEPDKDKDEKRKYLPGVVYMPDAYEMVKLKKHDPNHPVTAVVPKFADTGWIRHGCDLRKKSVSNNQEQQNEILKFQSEFQSKKNGRAAVLAIKLESSPPDEDKWTIAGFNDKGQFKIVLIDPSNELVVELNKEAAADEGKILRLATLMLGRTGWFRNCVDILQADYYPIPPIPKNNFFGNGNGKELYGIKYFVRKWYDEYDDENPDDKKKPFWFVAQAFDYSLGKEESKKYLIPDKQKRFPFLGELRTMSYIAIVSGARGILYYSLSSLRSEVRRPRNKYNPKEEGGYWKRLKSVTLELKELMPVLTADTLETIADKNYIVSMVKSDGTDTYVIAANYHARNKASREIEIPGIVNGTAEVCFHNSPTPIEAPINNSMLKVNLEKKGSRVYRIKGLK